MVRLIAFSDSHENDALEQRVASVARDTGLSVLFGGDLIDMQKHVQREFSVKKYQPKTQEEFKSCVMNLIEDKDAQERILNATKKRAEYFNETFSGIEWGYVRGNHDPEALEDILEGKNLAKETATFNGIRVAGGMNTYEMPMGIHPETLGTINDDVTYPEIYQALAQSYGSQEKLEEVLQKIPKEQIPEQFFAIGLQASPVYNRLKDENFNFYVTHKGPMNSSTTTLNGKPIPSGIGTSQLLAQKGVDYFCGHFHGPAAQYDEDIGNGKKRKAFKGSPNEFMILHFNDKTKRATHADIYKVEANNVVQFNQPQYEQGMKYAA